MRLDEMDLLINLILLSFILFSFVYTIIYAHEDAHRKIYEYYGIKSRIDIFNAKTIPTEEITLNSDEYNDMRKLHILNEIVGYNLVPVYLILIAQTNVILFFVSLFINILKKEKKQKSGDAYGAVQSLTNHKS
jgi:hypothetical protein